MTKLGQFLAKFWNDECGISSVEYALLLAFMGAGILIGAEVLSNAVTNKMVQSASCIRDTDTC